MPAGSDATAVAEEQYDYAAQNDPDFVVQGPEADMERDIAEQKELVAAFKQQREAAKVWNGQIEENAAKREREEVDAPPSFEFKEAHEIVPVGERAVSTNRRYAFFSSVFVMNRLLMLGL